MSQTLTAQKNGLTLIGRKIGMSQIFDKEGKLVVCTVIQALPNTVLQVKVESGKDGYNAIQLGSIADRKPSKPLKGKFDKIQVEACREIRESRMGSVEGYQAGQKIDLAQLAEAKFVDVEATSKGKGFQGVVKKFGFAGSNASHGHSLSLRSAGSTGMRSTPGRCFRNGKRASRMGGRKVTVQNLRVVEIKGDILMVEGAIPGAKSGVVYIRKSIKRG
jgi:large subunit ribosomal protein L3